MKTLLLTFVLALGLAACDSGGSDNNSGGDLIGGGNGDKGQVANNGEPINGMVNISGSWKGTPTLVVNGQNGQCDSLTMNFTQTATELKIVSGELVCNGEKSVIEPDTLAIENGQLKANGNQTGTINADAVVIQDGTDTLTFKREGDALSFIMGFRTEEGFLGQLSTKMKRQ